MRARLAENPITANFAKAAAHYDDAASVQAEVAQRLVQKASAEKNITSILDIGTGTGFVAEAASRQWPRASITAIDGAAEMLLQAKQKAPNLQIVTGDIGKQEFTPSFDLILSSMALHWLSDPRQEIMRWRHWLKPNGRLFVALLIDGSFREWRDLCAAHNLDCGLWPMPKADFADGIGKTAIETIRVTYPSAKDFLQRLKAIGAATPRMGHRPLKIPALRRLLHSASQPFPVTHRVLYIETRSLASI